MTITWQAAGFILTALLQGMAFIYGYGVLRTRVATMEDEMRRRRNTEDLVLEKLEKIGGMLVGFEAKLSAVEKAVDKLEKRGGA